MFHLLLYLSSVFSNGSGLEVTPSDINRKCFTCSVFTFIDNRLLCANPGVCYANYCYSYLLSDQRPMYLAGCAEDISDYPFRDNDSRTVCHARGSFGLCLCETTDGACNTLDANITDLAWINTDIVMMNAVSHRVTGFSADYAKNRVQQLRVEGFPETFPGLPLNNSADLTNNILIYWLGIATFILRL
ncbi:unnamed protein product [Auanema sp. JU1783]|nr:unnamed protein product [Auanema sp. JU1783]